MACETSDWMLGISHCLPWPESLGSGDGNKYWLNLCILYLIYSFLLKCLHVIPTGNPSTVFCILLIHIYFLSSNLEALWSTV